MNSHYIKGRKFEYKIVHDEQPDNGFIVRSAGSHSPYDVIVVDKDKKLVKCIQAKVISTTSEIFKGVVSEEIKETVENYKIFFMEYRKYVFKRN